MNLLLSGATGYTGRGLAEVLAAQHRLRGVDLARKPSACQELVVADITDCETCQGLVRGIDALVLCHMAPNPKGYRVPPPAFDVNVKATANLYHAAAEAGVRRVVLISSCCVLAKPQTSTSNAEIGIGPYNYGDGLYPLTKILQECIARHYYQQFGVATAALRPSWIVYDGELVTKYGQKMERYYESLIDPRDIGRAVLAALALPDLQLEAFNLGQDDLMADTRAARTRLGWSPEHRFASLPRQPA